MRTFRGRLRLFFALIVIVPMAAVASVALVVAEKSERASEAAALERGTYAARGVYGENKARAERALRRIERDERLTAALRRARPGAARARMAELVGRLGVASIALRNGPGGPVLRTGPKATIATASRWLESPSGARLGRLSVSAVGGRRYTKRVEEYTDFQLAVFRGPIPLASTLPALKEPLTDGAGESWRRFQVDGRDYSGQITRLATEEGAPLTIVVFDKAGFVSENSGASVLLVSGILMVGILVALGLSAFAVRENVYVHEHVERRALTDPITSLGNWNALETTLSREANRWRRHRVPFGVIYLDVDDFKAVNGRVGHPGGDAVLAAVAVVLEDESRDTDEAFRPGGDEFVVVLPHADIERATAVAHRLRQAMEGLVIQPAKGSETVWVTATLGVAAVANGSSEDGSSPEDAVIRAANEALHRAKAKGKNRVERA